MENKYSILIIDDDKMLLNMYSIKFSKIGLNVEAIGNSLHALKLLRDGATPNVLMIDIVMPNMDGLQLLETIRKEKLASKSIIIMLTNQNQSADIERAKTLGADGYIVKATTIPSEVVSEVMNIIKKHGL
ncbi:MAG: response regulator [Patescibacteria group bacterium]|nr:response regulator [Patescibacteria group bacterium]